MRIKLSIIVLLLANLSSAQGFLTAIGPDVVNDKGEKIILRGMGMLNSKAYRLEKEREQDSC